MKRLLTLCIGLMLVLSLSARNKKPKVIHLTDTTHFTVRVESMYPRRFPSRTVSYGYFLTMHGDSVSLYLPYMGEVYQPEFTNDGLNFDLPISDLYIVKDKKGRLGYTFRMRRGIVQYLFRVTLFPGDKAYIDLIPSNASSISYEGYLDDEEE